MTRKQFYKTILGGSAISVLPAAASNTSGVSETPYGGLWTKEQVYALIPRKTLTPKNWLPYNDDIVICLDEPVKSGKNIYCAAWAARKRFLEGKEAMCAISNGAVAHVDDWMFKSQISCLWGEKNTGKYDEFLIRSALDGVVYMLKKQGVLPNVSERPSA